MGCRESEAKVRSHPSDEEGWKNSSPREFGGPLSLEERRTYKGRVVLRMDNVKDEGGYKAALTEQGASASHMAAANKDQKVGIRLTILWYVLKGIYMVTHKPPFFMKDHLKKSNDREMHNLGMSSRAQKSHR